MNRTNAYHNFFLLLLLSLPCLSWSNARLETATENLRNALSIAGGELAVERYAEEGPEAPGVLESFSGNGTDSVMSCLVAYQDALDEALVKLAMRSGDEIAAGTNPDGIAAGLVSVNDLAADVLGLSVRLVERFRELLVRLALDHRYAAPDSPLHAAHKLRILQDMQALSTQARQVTDAIGRLETDLGATASAAPVLHLALDGLESGDGNRIDRLPLLANLRVNVRVRVHNRSGTAVSGAMLHLRIDTPSGQSIRVISGREETPLDVLDPEDGQAGSGPDETVVAWTLEIEDPSEAQGAMLRIEAEDTGASSPGFRANSLLVPLLTDPLAQDRDRDALPDAWEREHGLNPDLDDAASDPDGDGLDNLNEFALGTDPRNVDTDGDSISDSDELFGTRGLRTDPLAMDTDGDGTDDLADGAPLDAGDILGENLPEEPAVAVATHEVLLDDSQTEVQVPVTNAGRGTLTWAVEIDDDLVADLSPAVGELATGDGVLVIRWPDPAHDFAATAGIVAIVRVHDVTGGRHDVQEIRICHRSCDETMRRQPPTPFALVYPEDGATGLPTDLQLVWKRSRDPNGDAIRYQVLVCEDAQFADCAPRVLAPESAAFHTPRQGLAGLFGGVAVLGLLAGLHGRKRRNGVALVFLLTAWSLLACSDGGGFGQLDPPGPGFTPGADETALSVSGLAGGTTYYWKVIADDGNGGVTESGTRSFSTR